MTISDEELRALAESELRALADASADGPWYAERGAVYAERNGGTIAGCDTDDSMACYLAALDPTTILSLLDRLAALEATAPVVTYGCPKCGDVGQWQHDRIRFHGDDVYRSAGNCGANCGYQWGAPDPRVVARPAAADGGATPEPTADLESLAKACASGARVVREEGYRTLADDLTRAAAVFRKGKPA